MAHPKILDDRKNTTGLGVGGEGLCAGLTKITRAIYETSPV